MSSKTRNVVLTAVAILAVVSMLTPTVTAQALVTPKLVINNVDPISSIKPEVDTAQTKVSLTYSLDNAAYTTAGVVASQAAITVKFDCPPYIIVTGPSTVLITVSPGATDTSFDGTGTYKVKVTRDAPGLKGLTCKVTAQAAALQANTVGASTVQEDKLQVTATYFSLIQAKVANKVKQAGPQKQIPFEVELSNFGNAQTQITFSLGTENAGKWKPILPEVLTLDSVHDPGGKTVDTAIFTINTPFKNGWNNAEESFQLIMTPAAVQDASPGNPLTASMLARVRGVYVPTLEPTLMVAALLGAVLVVRSRKTE